MKNFKRILTKTHLNQKIFKTFIVSATSVLTIISLSSCSEKPEEIILSNTLNTISMFAGNDASANSYNSLLQSFSSENGVYINDSSEIATTEWKNKTTSNILSGQVVPDVMFFFTGDDAVDMVLSNKFVSIEEIRLEYPDYGKNIRPSTMEFVKEFDNKHYALPVKGFYEGLYCNTDMFLEYNLTLPTSWANLLSAIKKFNSNDITPIAVSLNETPDYLIEHLILASSSGSGASHQLNPYAYVPNSWVLALEKMIDMYAINAFSSNALENTNAEAVQSFVNKESAMLFDGSWSLGTITNDENTVILPVPSFDSDVENTDIISGFSSGYYISRQAWDNPSKRDLAVQFVSYMTSDNAIIEMCENGGIPASNVEIPKSLSPLDTSIETLQLEANRKLMPINFRMRKEAWEYLTNSVPLLLTEETTPSEVMNKVAELNIW